MAFGKIKEYYFNEINDLGGDFDDFYEDEMESMYQPIIEDKKAAKAAAKDLKEEFIEEDEPVNSDNDDLI